MEKRCNTFIGGFGLYATRQFTKGEILHVLSGQILDHPTRESIHVGNNKHVIDPLGSWINHSFNPTIKIDSFKIIACRDIKVDEEITFNYNEINMANPFIVEGIPVVGIPVVGIPVVGIPVVGIPVVGKKF